MVDESLDGEGVRVFVVCADSFAFPVYPPEPLQAVAGDGADHHAVAGEVPHKRRLHVPQLHRVVAAWAFRAEASEGGGVAVAHPAGEHAGAVALDVRGGLSEVVG